MNCMSSRVFACAALSGGLALIGCASTSSTKSEGEEASLALISARKLDQSVSQSGIGEFVPAEIEAARTLLSNAENEHQDNPGSNEERHLASLAVAEFEKAMAEAERLRAAKATLSQLEAERAARMKAEAAAKEATEQLGQVPETEEGVVLSLTGAVLFEFDKDELLPIAKERLKEAVEPLKGKKSPILIEGYTDAVGSQDYNKELSERRAKAVKDYLTELGLEPERIRTEGLGEKDPVATNETPEGRANNRRVEIVVEPQA